jgi:hypothetical protein
VAALRLSTQSGVFRCLQLNLPVRGSFLYKFKVLTRSGKPAAQNTIHLGRTDSYTNLLVGSNAVTLTVAKQE